MLHDSCRFLRPFPHFGYYYSYNPNIIIMIYRAYALKTRRSTNATIEYSVERHDVRVFLFFVVYVGFSFFFSNVSHGSSANEIVRNSLSQTYVLRNFM